MVALGFGLGSELLFVTVVLCLGLGFDVLGPGFGLCRFDSTERPPTANLEK